MEGDTCRNKAFKICSTVKGVSSVSMNEKAQLVVTGEDIDTVCLGKLLRKKFCSVAVLTVEEVKPKPPEEKKKEECKDKLKPCTISIVPVHPAPSGCHNSNCHVDRKTCLRIPKPNPNSNCHGTCKSCTNCESIKCHGDCKPCSRCESFKCQGSCKPCFRCESFKCNGSCKPCFRCGSYKCSGRCSSLCPRPPCSGKCPPWIRCSSCCIRPPNCHERCCDGIYVHIYLFVIVVIVVFVYAKHCGK